MRRFHAIRGLTALAAVAAVIPALAQQAPPPPNLEPLPEPPPAIGFEPSDATGEPGVNIRPGETVEEHTINGQRALRVVNEFGLEYWLIEAQPGDVPFAGAQNSDNRVRVPQWRLLQW